MGGAPGIQGTGTHWNQRRCGGHAGFSKSPEYPMGQRHVALRDVGVAGGIVRHDLLLELGPTTDKIRYVRKIPKLLHKPGNLVIYLLS